VKSSDVVAVGMQFQILKSIVVSVAVLVMHVLGRREKASYVLLDYTSVRSNRPFPKRAPSVFVATHCRQLYDTVAATAKLVGVELTYRRAM